eukprot:11533779-Heterocapsa_arctica.AAC.1
MELDAVASSSSSARPWRPGGTPTRSMPWKGAGSGTTSAPGWRQGGGAGGRQGEGRWSSPAWMALCRHCGGKHLHRYCLQAPSSSKAARPTPKAAPAPAPGKGKGKGKS